MARGRKALPKNERKERISSFLPAATIEFLGGPAAILKIYYAAVDKAIKKEKKRIEKKEIKAQLAKRLKTDDTSLKK
jgi:hypothetical protein